MNENLTEYANNDNLNEEELQSMESTEDVGEGTEVEGTTEENGNGELGVVPDEGIESESAHSEEILNEIKYNNELLETIIEIQEREPRTIFNTPLAEYNVLEGLTLIIVLTLMSAIIFGMVGGLIKWRE